MREPREVSTRISAPVPWLGLIGAVAALSVAWAGCSGGDDTHADVADTTEAGDEAGGSLCPGGGEPSGACTSEASCRTDTMCQECGYLSWTERQVNCSCSGGTWQCDHMDCGPVAVGYYTDSSCTTLRVSGADADADADAGADADADAETDSGLSAACDRYCTRSEACDAGTWAECLLFCGCIDQVARPAVWSDFVDCAVASCDTMSIEGACAGILTAAEPSAAALEYVTLCEDRADELSCTFDCTWVNWVTDETIAGLRACLGGSSCDMVYDCGRAYDCG